VPPAGLEAATAFPGFEDNGKTTFIRLIALPKQAFAEIDKTMTNEALKKQGMIVEKRETLKLPAGNAIMVLTRQETPAGRVRKWLLIAPLENLTAMVAFEMQAKSPPLYSDLPFSSKPPACSSLSASRENSARGSILAPISHAGFCS